MARTLQKASADIAPFNEVSVDIAPFNVTTVSTPEGLRAAVQSGARDIVITEHLDLTTIPLLDTSICEVGCESPLGEISTTRSIRGKCTTQPDRANFPGMNGDALVPTTSGQCFLLTHDDLLGIVSPQFWADNLYLRATLPEGGDRAFHFPALAVIPPLSTGGVAMVYLTNMIFQGDGEGSVVGIGVDDKVFVADSLFTSLGGARDLECDECSSNIEARAAVALKNCRFEKLETQPGSRYIRAYKGGSVWMQNNTFAAATKSFEITDSGEDKGIGWFSDVTSIKLEIGEDEFNTRAPSSLSEVPAEDPENPGTPLFLSDEDAWFVAITTEAEAAQDPPAIDLGATADAPTSEDSSVSSSLPIALALGAVSVLLVLSLVIFFVWARRRKSRRARAQQEKVSLHAPPLHTNGTHPGGHFASMAHWSDSHNTYSYTGERTSSPKAGTTGTSSGSQFPPSGAGALHGFGLQVVSQSPMHDREGTVPSMPSLPSGKSNLWSSGNGTQMTVIAMGSNRTEGTTFDTLSIPTTTLAPGVVPQEGASIDERMNFLHRQLDSLKGDRLLERFVLIGPQARRQGGQGLVAFATGAIDKLDYAVKFFLHRPSFLAERALYKSQNLGRLLPQIEGVYDPLEATSGSLLFDKGGNKMPPFIVMEKGESLIDWSKRNRSDVFQAVAVLAHVAMRLKDLHACGYVHRDIKPGNIMLLHRKNRWTLIDFGCVAPIGELAGLSFTLHYAAPEAVEAWYQGDRKIMADGALDAWALGVVAFELLTRRQAFQMLVQGKDMVVRTLRGEVDLPWEGANLAKVERKLGKMRGPVLALLARDPAQRMTCTDFVKECNALFAVDTMDLYHDHTTAVH